MFLISAEPINSERLISRYLTHDAGALVVFQGLVRDHNEGKKVSALEYQVYKSLAESEGAIILDEAKSRFDLSSIHFVHREGKLQVGDMAVWVAAFAAHRDAAFKACRFVIDEIKDRLPIWKKEYYHGLEPEWISCQGCIHGSSVKIEENSYYERQTILPEIGIKGQKRLKQAKLLVVGAGALGCPALIYLTSAGIGNITICDYDRIDITNLHRQTLYSVNDVGTLKAETAKKRLKDLNPLVHLNSFVEKVSIENVEELIKQHDLVLDCSDNFDTRFLLHDTCHLISVPLVQASVYQWEGQLQSFGMDQNSGCLRCLWTENPQDGCVGNCDETGVLGVVPGILGSYQALEVIHYLLGRKVISAKYTVLFDLPTLEQIKIKRTINPACPLCGNNRTITDLKSIFSQKNEMEVEVSLDKLSQLDDKLRGLPLDKFLGINSIRGIGFIDIREAHERDLSDPLVRLLKSIPNSNEFEFETLSTDKKYILICQKGIRSRLLAEKLRRRGLNNFYSLIDGIGSLRASTLAK